MTGNFTVKLVVIFLSALVAMLFPQQSQANSPIRFGENIRYVEVPGRILRQPILSPDGQFLFANGAEYQYDASVQSITTNVLSTNQYLWDLREIDFRDTAISLQSDQTLSLNETSNTAGSFSPAVRYLAIKTDTQVQLWHLPDFRLEKTITAISQLNQGTFYGSIAWSFDGQLLGVLINDAILVWDIEQNTESYFFFEYEYAKIQAIPNGWFISQIDGAASNNSQETGAFTVCDLLVETCQTNGYLNHDISLAAPDGSYILVPFGSPYSDGIVFVHRRFRSSVVSAEENGVAYIVDEQWQQQTFQDMGISGLCPQAISPNSAYIVSECPEIISIHDVTTQQPLSIIRDRDIYFISWLPDSVHFVIAQGPSADSEVVALHLYELGSEQPLDTLYLNEQPSLEDVKNLYIRFFTEDERSSITQNGRLLLVNAGFAAFLIPIEYE